MGLFEHFPYSNFHQLNIDWVLEKVKYCLAQVEAFATRLENAEDDIADLQSAVSNLQTALEALRTNLQNQINTLGSRVTVNESDIADLKPRMTAAEQNIEDLTGDIDDIETRMDTAENDIDALETSMATAETDIDTLEAFTASGSNDLITSHTASGAVSVTSKRRGYTRLYEIDFTVPDNASSVTFVFTNVVNGNYVWPIYRALGNGSYESAGLIQAHTGSCYVGNLTGGESYIIQALIM